ncbi:MAG: PA0069 family radical SAM protein [Burkholderiaceae bacterium]
MRASHTTTTTKPVTFLPARAMPGATKGRGAVDNPPGRFERHHRQLDESFGWTQDLDFDGVDAASAAPVTRVTEESARSIISRNQSPDVQFDQSINPYRGCEHGCIYCYARPNHAYVGLSAGQDFESRLFVKTHAAELLRRELASPAYRCREIAIGTATDAYQPIERERQATRRILEVLSETRHPTSVITKSALIERDIDLLAPMARQRLAHVGVTVTTLDAGLARLWEPRAAAPWRRIETIRRLSEAGIPVSVFIAPIVPFINDQDIERIAEAASQAGARSIRYTVIRLPWELQDVFVQWLRHHFPDREKRVLSRIKELRDRDRLNESEFFTRMRGKGPWAELIAMRIGLASRKFGLTRDRLDLRTDLFAPPRLDGQLDLF